MTKINLLPWREALREQRKQKFYVMLGFSVVSALLIMVAVHVTVENWIEQQTQRNTRLKQEIEVLDKKIVEIQKLKEVKASLIARMNIIERLQSDRALVVRLFHEIVEILPHGVHLTRVIRSENTIVFSGFAESNTHISDLMRAIEHSTWLQSPTLRESKTNKEDNHYAFSLRFQLHNAEMKGPIE